MGIPPPLTAGIADPKNLMLPAFSLSWFRFVLEPDNRLALHPRNPGNTLRDAFGSTFKRLVCPTAHECREICRLKATGPYGQIFEPSPPPGADWLSLNQDIPRPFVFHPPNIHETTTQPGNALSFDVILIGKALDYFPYFLVTFRELGDHGIGVGRGRYRIVRMSLLNENGNAAASDGKTAAAAPGKPASRTTWAASSAK